MKGATPYILLVDDNDDFRESLALLFEMNGYDVVTAANGKQALRRLRSPCRPAVVITDLMMPELDGWRLRQTMLDDPALASVPVIVLSASAVDEAKGSPPVVDNLRKPVDFNRLRSIVEASSPAVPAAREAMTA